MTRTPTTTQISIMKEFQAVLLSGSDCGDQPGGVLFSYAGPISDSSSDSIVTLVENAVSQCGIPRAELLRTKSVSYEMLKSMKSHGWIDDKGETMLFTTLTSADNGLKLCTGVLINDELSKAFESKFDKVNSMSTSDLRKRSIELLCNNEKLGINEPDLSIINIALNCNRPIEFMVENTTEKLNLIKVCLVINHSLS